jgi:hypothetical protein
VDEGHHKKRDQKPKLSAGICYRSVENKKLKEEILIKKRGEIVANATSLDVAHNEIEDYVNEKSHEHIAE